MASFLRVMALVCFVAASNCQASLSSQMGSNGEYSAQAEDEAITTVASIESALQSVRLSATALFMYNPKPVVMLNVTWNLPPDKGSQSSMSHIQIYSMAPDDDKYCQPWEYSAKDNLPGTTTSFLMPTKSEHNHGSTGLKIMPGCNYNVTLFNDEHVPKQGITVNYTVPDCVGTKCNCKPFGGIARPKVTLAKQLNATSVNITWSYPASEIGAVGVKITNFTVALLNSHGDQQLGFYQRRTILIVPIAPENDRNETRYGWVIPLREPLSPTLSYKVEVAAENLDRGCYGPSGGSELQVPKKPKNDVPSGSGQIWLTVLSSVTFVLACILACAMIWQRCGAWVRRKFLDRNLPPVQWQGIYKAVAPEVSRSRPNFPSMQHSVIYVEKEIEEAKARGEADTLEVSYGRLELGREIGKGAFGRVFVARAECIAGTPGFTTVAVKKLKQKAKNDEVEEFLSEIAMLKKVGRHPNIVTLLGCVTIRQPYCMIMEYIPCGDLLQYLRRLRIEYELRTGATLPFLSTRSRPPPKSPRYVELTLSSDSDGSYIQPLARRGSGRPSATETEWSLLSNGNNPAPLTPARQAPDDQSQYLEYTLDPKELQNFAVQIARGMEHLTKIKITHRDLAARNVLIDENKTLKISDFGLSRSGIYVNTKRKKVPLRWLSVEAIRDNLYSSKSDVWAFAIVLWEIGTLGGFPYPTINDFDLLNFLLDGKRLDKPDNCTDELYSLMLVCWSHAVDSRPTFADLVSHLDSVICRRRVYVNFEDLRPDYTFPPTEQQKSVTSPSDDQETSGSG